MTIWQEMFRNPTPTEEPSMQEWNLAWNWIFEQPSEAAIRLATCRKHSLALRRQGIKKSAQMATVGVWKSIKNDLVQKPAVRPF